MAGVILVLEDEIEIRRLLKITLSSAGYSVLEAPTASDGEVLLATRRPDLVILDLGLPDLDGQEFLMQIREWSNVPVLVLSARDLEQQKIEALENGADDYLTKPFSSGELLARIKVALRHAAGNAGSGESVFRRGELEIDFASRLVRVSSEEIHLTPIEYKLLLMLARNAGKVLTHSQLIREIWGKRAPESNQGLRIHMQHLREKLRDNPLEPRFIFTEPGIGYRFRS